MKFMFSSIRIFTVSLVVLGSLHVAAAEKKSAVVKNTASVLKNVNGTVKWTGFGVGKSHSGTISIKSGEVTLDPKKGSLTKAQFVLDMTSLNTPDSDKLKGHLKSPDFFDVEKYPEAFFTTTSVESVQSLKAGDPSYKVKGDLKIKGKIEPIEFMLAVSKKDGAQMGHATAEIVDRTKYGIVYNSKQYSTVSKLGDKLIEDNIKLEIDVTAK